MGFTLAHPAVVLPFLKLNRQYVSATGLVVGSMAPDFGHFVLMEIKGQHNHAWTSLAMIDLPLALLVSILFHQVIKSGLIPNLPAFLQSRFSGVLSFDFKAHILSRPFAFLLSVLIGMLTHLVWDAFTHYNGFMATRFDYYQARFPFDGVNYPMFYALQWITSYAGLAAISLYVALMKADRTVVVSKPSWKYWLLVISMVMLLVWLRFLLGRAAVNLPNILVTSITSAFLSMLVAAKVRFRTAN